MILVLTFIPQSLRLGLIYWLWTSLPFTIFIICPFLIPLVAIIRAVEIKFVQLNEFLVVPKELVLVFTDVMTFSI